MRRLGYLMIWLLASTAFAANDDSCDIGVAPAATLLLPHFEVDFRSFASTALTTRFTVINTSHLPQIARATIWSDWGYPAFTFELFLTGYDVANVDLYELLNRGALPKSVGETPGEFSAGNTANPNHLPSMPADCAARPTQIPELVLRDLRSILTTGRTFAGALACPSPQGVPQQVGSNHSTIAFGYVTIDVVATCSSTLPDKADYYLKELLYDNVLIGDWAMINPNYQAGNYAGGAPLVHIRAIPEGGPAGTIVPTRLPLTFHDRLTGTAPRSMDRRQPLPSTFAARYIQGGTGSFETKFAIWRESVTGAGSRCTEYVNNSNLDISEVVRFDEHENAVIHRPGVIVPGPNRPPGTTSSYFISSVSQTFPTHSFPSDDVSGWMYLNLHNAVTPSLPSRNQAWVTTFMYAEGRYAVAQDATALANGCTTPPARGARVGPGANVTP